MATERPSKKAKTLIDEEAASPPMPAGEEKGGDMWRDIKEDFNGLAILMVLYVLQGIPMGLAGAIPMILKDRGVPLSDIGTFTATSIPYSIKLLWAPIVDAIYVKSIGRRKTWLVPCQILIALVLIFAPIGQWVEELDVSSLTLTFVFLYFLCATQDIAVDGWALTMLSDKNVSYGSVCNSVGQTLGFFISLTGYLSLNSYGLVTLSQFCVISGLGFFAVTVLIMIFKSETSRGETESIADSYKGLYSIIRSPLLWELLKVLMVWKIPFGVASVASLKLQENNVPKETLALLSTCIVPVNIATPILCAKWTTGKRPFDAASHVYTPRVLLGIPTLAVVLWSSTGAAATSPALFYTSVVLVAICENVLMTIMFTSQMCFFARISDSSLGGSYMTVLNTAANLGTLWVITFSLKVCDSLTINGTDGFYTLVACSSMLGLIWYMVFGKQQIHYIGSIPRKDWLIKSE